MTNLPLARAHPSIFGAPVLRTVDTQIFALRYFTHCMSCGFCGDQCCSYGVDIDAENADKLLALGDGFEAFVGRARRANGSPTRSSRTRSSPPAATAARACAAAIACSTSKAAAAA